MSTYVGLSVAGEGSEVLIKRAHGGFDPIKLHLTLAFLSEGTLPEPDYRQVQDIVQRRAKIHRPFSGRIVKCEWWPRWHVALIESDSRLYHMRSDLVYTLSDDSGLFDAYSNDSGLPYSVASPFTPHVSFGIAPNTPHLIYEPNCYNFTEDWGQAVTFPSIFVVCGLHRTTFELRGDL